MESRYWKELLYSTAIELGNRKTPKYLTQRRCEIIERDVIICFFIIRRLIELSRVSKITSDYQFDIFSSPSNGRKSLPTDRTGIEKSYDLNNETSHIKHMKYVSNQFIHSSMFIVTYDYARNWESFYVVSDYDEMKNIWRIPVKQVAKAFKVASNDYLKQFSYKLNREKNDYVVVEQ